MHLNILKPTLLCFHIIDIFSNISKPAFIPVAGCQQQFCTNPNNGFANATEIKHFEKENVLQTMNLQTQTD